MYIELYEGEFLSCGSGWKKVGMVELLHAYTKSISFVRLKVSI